MIDQRNSYLVEDSCCSNISALEVCRLLRSSRSVICLANDCLVAGFPSVGFV